MHNLTIELNDQARVNFLAMVAGKVSETHPGEPLELCVVKSAILHADGQNCRIEATVFEPDKAPLKFDREGH